MQPRTIRFEFNDGTPYPQTIDGQTASEWKLIQDATSPTGAKWIPLQ